MNDLKVLLEKQGKRIPVGRISGIDPAKATFSYDPEYVEGSEATPISISLPVKEEPFSPRETAAFFEGLLPEGFTRRTVAHTMQVDEGDYIAMLHGLGRECLGAICILEDGGDVPEATYEPITYDQVRELAAEGVSRSAEIVARTHLSLTGASGKVGLYQDESSKHWFLPKGTAPSTHIVKQSHVMMKEIVANEMLSMETARRCGIDVPDCFIIDVGEGGESDVLFVTRRYDRQIPDDCDRVSGLKRPRRLHQEDFAQAMGIPASDKYEKKDGNHLRRMVDLLRKTSTDPIDDIARLWDRIIFNCLIGNTDAHIKNFSILYDDELRGKKLAPAYDIISTMVYEQSTREMAFRIGDRKNIDEITADTFRVAARESGMGENFVMSRLDDMREKFGPALMESAIYLADHGHTKAMDIAKQIQGNSPIG